MLIVSPPFTLCFVWAGCLVPREVLLEYCAHTTQPPAATNAVSNEHVPFRAYSMGSLLSARHAGGGAGVSSIMYQDFQSFWFT